MATNATNAYPDENRRAIVERYIARTPASKRAHDRALKVLPAGVNRNIVHHGPHPLFVRIGEGAYLEDLDGNRYLDLVANYTAMILGNCVPSVMAAAEHQIRLGTAWSAASPLEAELAEMLVERLPSAEQVRFTASGTESTMLAMRAARAFTGRPLVAKFEGGYHGLNDYAMVSVAPPLDQAGPAEAPRSVGTPGVPPGTVESMVVLPFNDPAAVEAIVARQKDRLSAIIVEPLLGAGGTILPQPGFLAFLRELTRRCGILLIFDEVISFRLAWGGAQAFYGVTPDLTTLGKIIGGGYPIGAIAGNAEVMARFDPTRPDAITLSGTFHANPVALAAGIATLKLLTPDAIERLNRRTARFVAAVEPLLARAALPLRIQSVGSLFNIHASAEPVTDYRAAARGDKEFLKLLHLALLNEGVLISPRGLACLSVPMTDSDLDALALALERALAATGALRALAAAEA